MELHTWNVTEACIPPRQGEIWLENPEAKEQHPLPQRYFIKLSYRGAPFHGWQSQPNAISVQSTIEEALETLLRRNVKIVGAGRTDTGVNARMMFAHFDAVFPDGLTEDRFLSSINRLVGKDIAIESLLRVHNRAHARFDATSRTYKYFVALRKTPFFYPFSWLATSDLAIEKMNMAASLLMKTEDFTSFAKLHGDAKTNICRVTEARWEMENGFLVFTITADRFLRNMVRAIVGTLVDVGRGKLTIDRFKEIIEEKDRCSAGTSMPPEALYLWNITYPYLPR